MDPRVAPGSRTGEQVAERYVESLAAMDEEALVVAFAPDAVVHNLGPVSVRGRPAIRELLRSIFAVAKPGELEPELIMAFGETVAVMWKGSWTMLERLGAVGGIDVFELDESGRICAWWAHWDASAPVLKDG